MTMNTHLFVCVLVAGMGLASPAPQEKSGSTIPRKGDTITVKGCLRGGAVEATGVDAGETAVPLADNLTFRLTGKGALKELKKKHDGRVVAVTGVLKSELSPRGPDATAKVGNMRIGIGAPSTNPASVDAGNRRVLPVLEVQSFEGIETSCAR